MTSIIFRQQRLYERVDIARKSTKDVLKTIEGTQQLYPELDLDAIIERETAVATALDAIYDTILEQDAENWGDMVTRYNTIIDQTKATVAEFQQILAARVAAG